MSTREIQAVVAQAVAAHYEITDITPEVTYPDAGFGDFSTNVAFHLAKRLKKAPQAIASELAPKIQAESIETVQATGGFINLTLSQKAWIEAINQVGSDYGSCDIGKGRKLQVEFISANPTGPTTIGNARGGFIGDVLARVMSHAGYDVTREYYFNNAGTQIRKLVESAKVAAGVIQMPDHDVQYRGDYIKELAEEHKQALANKSDDELGELLTQSIFNRYIKPAVAKMGIEFDVWFNERDVISDGSLNHVIQRLEEQGLVYERDGAKWLDSGKLGDNREERVIVKSNGDPTYLAPDIAYHVNIFETRGFDAAIKVLGPDHNDQFPSVKAAVGALCPGKELTMASYQWLRVIREGKEVKVSKRLGQFITIEELIDEVGLPVARFLTLMRSPDSHMDFDLDLAKEQSQKNPLYYVMYSYARAQSILEQAAERKLKPAAGTSILSPAEVRVVRHISRFPGLLKEIATDYGVHRLTFYGIELAKLFHDLYESERILSLKPDVVAEKLYVISQYVEFMELYFRLMGIEPVKKMHQSQQLGSE